MCDQGAADDEHPHPVPTDLRAQEGRVPTRAVSAPGPLRQTGQGSSPFNQPTPAQIPPRSSLLTSSLFFSLFFLFFLFSPKPVWVALCVDGQEDGQACLESALPPEIGPTDAYGAFMRGYCSTYFSILHRGGTPALHTYL
jgi:hypothetical protein